MTTAVNSLRARHRSQNRQPNKRNSRVTVRVSASTSTYPSGRLPNPRRAKIGATTKTNNQSRDSAQIIAAPARKAVPIIYRKLGWTSDQLSLTVLGDIAETWTASRWSPRGDIGR